MSRNMNTGITPLIAAILLLREVGEDYIFDNGFHINTKCIKCKQFLIIRTFIDIILIGFSFFLDNVNKFFSRTRA